MKKVLIDYGRLTPDLLVGRAESVASELKDNDSFPALPITLAAIGEQTIKVKDAATAAQNRDRQLLAVLRNEKLLLANMLRTTAEYVNTTAAGNEAVLLTSGFVLSKTPEKNQLPGVIDKIAAHFTNMPQTINLEWSRSKHTRFYNVMISNDNGQTWQLAQTVSGRKLLVNQLVSNQRYQFKVIPVNSHGKGIASDVASQIAA
ncbi:MAG TPA: fibronectin type III domain-containing protein [Bacteroidia bacterium]|nr:fibronectin type III domain-containing protein [Bacteroidia bacterium]HNU34265.1 fibronectin type III domain-containing protein [Bacteroidia bacterium]